MEKVKGKKGICELRVASCDWEKRCCADGTADRMGVWGCGSMGVGGGGFVWSKKVCGRKAKRAIGPCQGGFWVGAVGLFLGMVCGGWFVVFCERGKACCADGTNWAWRCMG